VYRTVDVAFGSEMNYGLGFMLLEETRHELAIGDIPPDESVERVVRAARKVLQIASVRKLVEIDYRSAFRLQPVQYEVRTDKSGAAGHKDQSGSCSRQL
jgi:hypothetical protein